VGEGRSVDRLINFSDAVVAVAVTVLVLPLVDIEGPAEGETVWTVVGDHASQIWTFLFTFYVVAVLWLAHNRILNAISRYDPAIFWVNTTWLAAIVLLPWVSAMYGESEWGRSGVGLAYWGTMATISLLVSALGAHLRRHPELLAAGTPRLSAAAQRRAALRGPVLGLYFLLIGVASMVTPAIASWLPLGIIPLSIWLRPAASTDIEPS
jgi:TMEM175 potassium channel family protein